MNTQEMDFGALTRRAEFVRELRRIRDHGKGLSHAMRHTISQAADQIEAIDKRKKGDES